MLRHCLKLHCILMLTQSKMWWLNSILVCFHLQNESAVTGFSVGATESITLPLISTLCRSLMLAMQETSLQCHGCQHHGPAKLTIWLCYATLTIIAITLLHSLCLCSLGIWIEQYVSHVNWLLRSLKPWQFRLSIKGLFFDKLFLFCLFCIAPEEKGKASWCTDRHRLINHFLEVGMTLIFSAFINGWAANDNRVLLLYGTDTHQMVPGRDLCVCL